MWPTLSTCRSPNSGGIARCHPVTMRKTTLRVLAIEQGGLRCHTADCGVSQYADLRIWLYMVSACLRCRLRLKSEQFLPVEK